MAKSSKKRPRYSFVILRLLVVFVEERRACRRPRKVRSEGTCGRAYRAEGRVLVLNHRSARQRLRVTQCGCDIVDLCARHTRSAQNLDPFRDGALLKCAVEF